MFLANYSDGLSDLDCNAYIDAFKRSDKVARFLSVRVPQTFHIVHADDEHNVNQISELRAGRKPAHPEECQCSECWSDERIAALRGKA